MPFFNRICDMLLGSAIMVLVVFYLSAKSEHLSILKYLRKHNCIMWMFISMWGISNVMLILSEYTIQKDKERFYHQITNSSFSDISQAKKKWQMGVELIVNDNRNLIFFPKNMLRSRVLEYFDKDFKASKKIGSDTIYLSNGHSTIHVLCAPPLPMY